MSNEIFCHIFIYNIYLFYFEISLLIPISLFLFFIPFYQAPTTKQVISLKNKLNKQKSQSQLLFYQKT